MLFLATCLFLTSCSKENNDEPKQTPQEVTFNIDYTFIESGSMTRASSDDVYNNFYDKYIKTKQLTPTTYSLTFSNKEGKVLEINGKWADTNGIRLPEGEYKVKGCAYPIERSYYSGKNYYPSDTVYLYFDESVTITKDMKTLTLKALYDSWLLLFDTQNIKEVELKNTSSTIEGRTLSQDSDIHWLFIKDKFFVTTNAYFYLYIKYKNLSNATITLLNIPFENGKYYYFNDLTNSFDIPKMESGN